MIASQSWGRPTRRVFVRDLMVDAEIGVFEHEKGRHQKVRINVDVVADASLPHDDSIANVLCYRELSEGIRAIIAAGHVHLVETLADQIAALALGFSGALEVTVRVEKLEAIPGTSAVGVEIHRVRQDA
ncbi:dihydroneopterin aldolase [Parapedomonas caeni]|jgi:dihydroneopterin aldolase